MVAKGQEMVTEKSRHCKKKVRKFCFESGNSDSLKKNYGKLNYFNTADLIALRAGRKKGICDPQ